MVKRVVTSGEANKNISGKEHKQNNPNKQIDIKKIIRNLTISMVLNLVDIRISNNYNTLPIKYKDKEKGDKFINYDPNFYFDTANDPDAKWYKKNLVASEKLSQNLNAENFFASLKAIALGQGDFVPENAVYFNNLKKYFSDIDTNIDKQKDVVQILQKIPYKYEQNKDKIDKVILDFKKQGGDFKSKIIILSDCRFFDSSYGKQEISVRQIADNLEAKIDRLQLVTKEFGKKFEVEKYKERDFSNSSKYQAQKVEPALTNEILEDIHKKLGGENFNKLNISIHSQKQYEIKQESLIQKLEPHFTQLTIGSATKDGLEKKLTEDLSAKKSFVDALKKQRGDEGINNGIKK